jgi:hypothetical protein
MIWITCTATCALTPIAAYVVLMTKTWLAHINGNEDLH